MQLTGVTECTTYELACSSCGGPSIGDVRAIAGTCSRCQEGTLQPTGRVLAYDCLADGHAFIDPDAPLPHGVRRMESDWPGGSAFSHRYVPEDA